MNAYNAPGIGVDYRCERRSPQQLALPVHHKNVRWRMVALSDLVTVLNRDLYPFFGRQLQRFATPANRAPLLLFLLLNHRR